MINSTKQRFLFAIDGIVNTTVAKDSLGKGQFMIGDIKKPGVRPATNLSTIRKDEKRLKILVGEDQRANSRSFTHGASETEVFSLSQIVEIRQTNPKILEPSVDEWVVGWTGRADEPETSLKFTKSSKPFRLFMTINGGGTPYSGGGLNSEVIDFSYPIEDSDFYNSCVETDKCDPIPCQGIVEDIVKRLKRRRTSGGRVLEELVDIFPTVSCVESTATDEITYWTMSVCDTGDAQALSKVQGAYPDLVIKRLGRVGAVTTYQTMAETIPADYEYSNVQIIPTCSVCPGGFTTLPGGWVYVVTLVDEGADESATLDTDLQADGNTVTVVRQGTESGTNVGVYSVLATNPFDDGIPQEVLDDYPSVTISLVGHKDTVCSDTDTLTVDWIEGDTCELSTETYDIVLPDNECGTDRLSELQIAYPELTIVIAPSNSSLSQLALSGTSGTANVNVNGVNYLATFATNLNTTAVNFVTAHASAIFTESGVTVTADPVSGKIYFEGLTTIVSAITITNVTTNLAGTPSVVEALPSREACTTKYLATVGTNMVCEECDDVFKDYFLSKAPEIYDGVQWNLVTRASNSGTDVDCLCGIRFKAKLFKMEPDSRHFYKYPYIETSASIFVDAGFQDFEDLVSASKGFSVPAHKRQMKFKKDRDMLVGHLMPQVRHANMHSHGLVTGFNQMQDDFLGMTLPFNDFGAQVVQFAIDIAHNRTQQGFQDNSGVTRTVNIYVEYGKHQDILDVINDLASASNKQVLNV